MNVVANRDQHAVTVLVEAGDVAVLATAERDAGVTALLEALSTADQQLQHGLAIPQQDAREATPERATDGGRA